MDFDPTSLIRAALFEAGSSTGDEVPIGAVIADHSGKVIASGRNLVHETGDISAHAEILAIRQLSVRYIKAMQKSLTLAVTLEPCPMCAWVIRMSGIGRVVFGAYNRDYGAGGTVFDLLRDSRFGRPIEVFGGVMERECSQFLSESFREIRDNGTR